MRVGVVDGQGGGIGAVLIKAIRAVWPEEVEVWALGTNAAATAQMMKARANRGASGENAVCACAARVDVIIGPLGLVLANAMMGEVTPRMAQAVMDSPALKLLLPLTQEPVEVLGLAGEPLPHLVDQVVARLKELKGDV